MIKFLTITGGMLLFATGIMAQNMLYIPPALTGTTFNLNVQNGTRSFYQGTTTPTLGINGDWLSPTIIVNKGDSITLNVINNLTFKTTMHWHGLHVSPKNDGGPHQSISPGTTWSPSFKIRNNASTFWYHPHGAGQTDPQVSGGLAGLFIVHDPDEQALDIPGSYGVDDIPVIVQSKGFDVQTQIAIATDMDTAIFINGTINPYYDVPAQVVRFRVLNGSSLRSFNLGLSDNKTFYQIGTDGGLLDTPRAMTRILLSPGERIELLADFTGMTGNAVYLKSFASEMPEGIYGAAVVGSGVDTIHDYQENYLNGLDFNLLQLNIITATANPVTAIPASLVPLVPFDPATATKNRIILLDTMRLLPAEAPNRAEGPFGINNATFDMDVINETVYLNTTEIWTLVNNTLVAHPFHIHDIQFNVIKEGGATIPPAQRGWKDVVLVMPGDTVQFLTKFETFTDPEVPYMYHCHLLHHEDDGMMGTFIVIDSTAATGADQLSKKKSGAYIYPNPSNDAFHIRIPDFQQGTAAAYVVTDITGRKIDEGAITADLTTLSAKDWANGFYLLTISGHVSFSVHKISKQ